MFAKDAPRPSMVCASAELAQQIKHWGRELGFQKVGISALELEEDADRLEAWLAAGCHGEMGYMARNADLRRYPERLVPGARRAICVRMDYRPDRKSVV